MIVEGRARSRWAWNRERTARPRFSSILQGRQSLFATTVRGRWGVADPRWTPLTANSQTCPAGIQKHDSLSKFFDSVLDGTADLTIVNKEAAAEEFVPDEEMLEIERKQEAQRIALAHGGYSDIIDFEEAIKNGAGADFHQKHGFPGMMGGPPPKKAEAGEEQKGKEDDDPIHRILKHQQEAEKQEREKPKMAKTDDAQVAFKAEETGHPRTPVAGEAASAAATDTPASEASSPVVEPEAPSSSVAEEAPVETEEAKVSGHVADEL